MGVKTLYKMKMLRKYPDAVCINLGCGFDDKFSQVDNGKLTWFDVDLPDQIVVRRKVYEDRERCTMMDGNALDGSWTDGIPDSEMYFIIYNLREMSFTIYFLTILS